MDNLLVLHEGFLNELKRAVSFDWEEPQYPVSPNTMDSSVKAFFSSRIPPELIGTVVLENFRKLGPAHEAYSTAHELSDAVSTREAILSQ